VVDKPNALLSLYRKSPNVNAKKEKKTRYMELFMAFLQPSATLKPDGPTHIVFDLSITPTSSEFKDNIAKVRHAGEDPPFDIDITAQRYDPAVKIKANADGTNLIMNSNTLVVLLKTESPSGQNLKDNGFKDHITGFYKQVLDYYTEQENDKMETKDNEEYDTQEKACPAPQKYRIVYLNSNQTFYLVNAEDQLSLEAYLSTDISDYMTVFTKKRNAKKYVGLFEKLLPYDKAAFVINNTKGGTTGVEKVFIDVTEFLNDNDETLPFVFHKDFYKKYITKSGVSKSRFYEIATLLFKQIYTRSSPDSNNISIKHFTRRSEIPNASVFYKLFSLSENTMKKRSQIYYDQEMDVKQRGALSLILDDQKEMNKYIYSDNASYENDFDDDDQTIKTSRASRTCMVSKSDISFDLDDVVDSESVSENTFATANQTVLGENYTIVKYFSKKQQTTVDLEFINKRVLSYLTICFLLQKWYAILYPNFAPTDNMNPYSTGTEKDITEIKHEFRMVLLSELKKQQILYDENMILCDIEHILEKGQYGAPKDDADIILLSNPKELSSKAKQKTPNTKQHTDVNIPDDTVLKDLKFDINGRIDNSFFDDHNGGSKFGRLLDLNLNNDKKTGDKSNKTGTKTTEPKDDIEKAIKNLTRVKKLIENMKNELFILAEPPEPKKDNTAELTQNMKHYAGLIKNNLVETYRIFADANGSESPPIPDFTYTSHIDSMVEISDLEVKNNLNSYSALKEKAISQAAEDPALNNTIKTLIQKSKDQKSKDHKSKDNKHLIDNETNNPNYTAHSSDIHHIYSTYCSSIPQLKGEDNKYPLSSLIKYYLCVKDALATNHAKKFIENLLDKISKPLVDYLFEHCLDVYIQCIVLAKVYLSKLKDIKYKYKDTLTLNTQLDDCIPSILQLRLPSNLPAPTKPATDAKQAKEAKQSKTDTQGYTEYINKYTEFLQWAIGVRSNDIYQTINPLLPANTSRK